MIDMIYANATSNNQKCNKQLIHWTTDFFVNLAWPCLQYARRKVRQVSTTKTLAGMFPIQQKDLGSGLHPNMILTTTYAHSLKCMTSDHNHVARRGPRLSCHFTLDPLPSCSLIVQIPAFNFIPGYGLCCTREYGSSLLVRPHRYYFVVL
jgi:hypothetical protein